jgi:hypothetical protein
VRPIVTARQKTRIAVVLWLVLAGVVWNVIFDHLRILADRRYVYDATMAVRRGQPFLLIDSVHPQAIRRGVRIASLVAGAIAVAGLGAIALASRLDERRRVTTDPRA